MYKFHSKMIIQVYLVRKNSFPAQRFEPTAFQITYFRQAITFQTGICNLPD